MIGYVAKDKDGEIYLHREKPNYDSNYEGWFASFSVGLCITNEFSEFDNLKYTDEPVKVEIKLEKI